MTGWTAKLGRGAKLQAEKDAEAKAKLLLSREDITQQEFRDFASFLPFADNVYRATERARGALFLMLLVSALLLALATEKVLAPWVEIRLDAYNVLAQNLSAAESMGESDFVNYVVDESRREKIEGVGYLKDLWLAENGRLTSIEDMFVPDFNVPVDEVLEPNELRDLRNAARVAHRLQRMRHFAGPDDFKGRLDNLRQKKFEHGYIKLPLLDFDMDSNSLTPMISILATFCYLVMFLAYKRENQAMRNAYDVAHELFPKQPKVSAGSPPTEAYNQKTQQNLVMRQLCRDLITIGHVLTEANGSISVPEVVTACCLVLPPIGICVHLISDVMTLRVGLTLNAYITWGGLVTSSTCLLSCMLLTVLSWRIGRKTKKFWSVWQDNTNSIYDEDERQYNEYEALKKKNRKARTQGQSVGTPSVTAVVNIVDNQQPAPEGTADP